MQFYAYALVWGVVLASALTLILCCVVALVEHHRDRAFEELESWFSDAKDTQ